MAEIVRQMWKGYNVLFEDLVDQRTKSWFLVAKPYQGLTILFLYLMFVLKWGPNWMKNRRPFKLDKVLLVYNLTQVIVCTYIFIGGLKEGWGWGAKYKMICEPVDYSDNGLPAAHIAYWYYLTKIVDLLDTVFFVLRKKFNQVSFLHVYHHTGMVMLIWAAVTYYPGGHGTLVGVINCFVHIVMYSYYFLAVAYPAITKQLWLKKYITQLQIVQFFWNVVHMGVIVFVPNCGYPRWTAAVFLPQNIFMLILFLDFYIKNYIRSPKLKSKAKLEDANNSKDNNNEKNSHSKNSKLKNLNPKNHLNEDEIYKNGIIRDVTDKSNDKKTD